MVASSVFYTRISLDLYSKQRGGLRAENLRGPSERKEADLDGSTHHKGGSQRIHRSISLDHEDLILGLVVVPSLASHHITQHLASMPTYN